jgi:uncharacterized membrane protein
VGFGFGFLALFLGSAAILAVGYLGLTEKLPRNHFAGIRVRYTLKSDEHWREVHRAAGPYIILVSAAVLAASLSFMPFAFAGKIPAGLAGGMFIGMAAFLGIAVLVASLAGLSKAKKNLGQ